MVLIPSYCNNKNMSNIHKYERLFYGPVKKREFVFSQAPVSFSGQTERYYYNS